MAYATQITISTGNKVSLNYQSQEVSVTLTYQIEREDTDVLAVVKEKTVELAQAHHAAWQTLHDAKVSTAKSSTAQEEMPEKPKKVPESPIAQMKTVSAPAETADPPPPEPIHESPQELSQTKESPVISSVPASPITPGQLAALLLLLTEARWSEQRRCDYLHERFSCEGVDDLSAEQAKEWLLALQRAEREAAQQRRLENSHRNGTP